jgi:methionyl-tRNA formyltransferase
LDLICDSRKIEQSEKLYANLQQGEQNLACHGPNSLTGGSIDYKELQKENASYKDKITTLKNERIQWQRECHSLALKLDAEVIEPCVYIS